MYNLIPLFIILASLGLIAYIFFRKFPALANLDVNNLFQERELRKKQAIIAGRIEEKRRAMREVWDKRLRPLKRIWGILQLRFRVYVGKIERLYHHEQAIKGSKEKKTLTTEEKQKQINEFVKQAEESFKAGQFEKTEELYISAIKLNSKSLSAYRGLADTYFSKGSLEEAGETYKFVLQLRPYDDNVMVKLAEIAESQGDMQTAIDYYQDAVLVNDSLSPRFYHLAELLVKIGEPDTAKEAIVQAVELEPKNPRYLDLLIEIAIICQEKTLATKACNELRLVNPENHKLEIFKEQIAKI